MSKLAALKQCSEPPQPSSYPLFRGVQTSVLIKTYKIVIKFFSSFLWAQHIKKKSLLPENVHRVSFTMGYICVAIYVCTRECNQQQAFQFPIRIVTTSNANQNHQNYRAIVCLGTSKRTPSVPPLTKPLLL